MASFVRRRVPTPVPLLRHLSWDTYCCVQDLTLQTVHTAPRALKLLGLNQRLVDDAPELGAGGLIARGEYPFRDLPHLERFRAAFKGTLNRVDQSNFILRAAPALGESPTR